MSTTAGYMRMGTLPVAGRARAMHACVSGRSFAASAHLGWQTGLVATANQAKPATEIAAVPDTRYRRPWGTP